MSGKPGFQRAVFFSLVQLLWDENGMKIYPSFQGLDVHLVRYFTVILQRKSNTITIDTLLHPVGIKSSNQFIILYKYILFI